MTRAQRWELWYLRLIARAARRLRAGAPHQPTWEVHEVVRRGNALFDRIEGSKAQRAKMNATWCLPRKSTP